MTQPEDFLHEDYTARINKVFQFIEEHFHEALNLETVAQVAAYSPFHFHRIFKAITNETLNAYINRRRIEKAAGALIHHSTTVTELALELGFNSNSSFTRAFKNYYGISPTEFRKQSPNRYSKIRQTDSKNGQAKGIFEPYVCAINNLIKWTNMNANIEIKTVDEIQLAYVTAIGKQEIAPAFETLLKWATPKGILNNPEAKVVMIYHDSFKVTAPDKVRMSAAVSINESVETARKVGKTILPKSKCIVARYAITLDEFEKSWMGLFIWMSENGYKKATANPFEIHHNNFREHPEQKSIVDFCIPVE